MTNLVKMAIPLLVLFTLTACGGGGGGGAAPTPAESLTGTVTDTTQAAVAGVQISVTNAATSASVASTTSDEVGRYSLRGLPTNTPLRVVATGAQGYFPMSALVTLTSSGASVVDVVLPSTRDKATAVIQSGAISSGAAGGTVISSTTIGSGETASLTVPANSLLDASAAVYTGSATVYLAPLEVGKMGTGFAPYQVVLPAAAGNSYPADFPSNILELYAATALDIVAADGSTLAGDGTTTTLTMPVPSAPAYLRSSAAAAATPILWRYDTATSSWVEASSVPTFNAGTNSFSAAVAQTGIYAVGVTSAATSISGSLLYSDGLTPAAGVTVYVTGLDAAYQQTVFSDSAGHFSALVKDASQARLDFVSWGYGLQLSGSNVPDVDLAIDLAAIGDITLAYAQPVKGVSSAAVVQLDEADVSAPVTAGIILSSGRVLVQASSGGVTDTLANTEIADVVLVAEANDIGAGGIRTFKLAVGHSGTVSDSQIRVAGDLTYVPEIRLDTLDLTTPVNIEVVTANGHSGVLTISAIGDGGHGLGFWQVTLSSSFTF